MADAPSPSLLHTALETELRKLVRAASERRLSWAQVMELALYHPEHGYYSGKPRRIGRSGDFYTAVSVGPLYGRLLGELALECWRDAGKPERFTLIEQGAHDGTLMHDLWLGLQNTDLAPALHLCLIEHREAYRTSQAATLGDVPPDRLHWISSLDEVPATGLFLCNELLDAFPVHRVRWHGGQWQEGFVVADHELAPLTLRWFPPKFAETKVLPTDLPEDYTTEVHPACTHWMSNLGHSAFTGPVLIADYGYEASEYYTAERAHGTLRRYHQHKSDTEVLQDLGNGDLTAHINFTAVIDAATEHGRAVQRFLPQGRFLTQLAEPWLRSLDGRAPDANTRALLAQFQTLTHPSHMGTSFRLLLLSGR